MNSIEMGMESHASQSESPDVCQFPYFNAFPHFVVAMRKWHPSVDRQLMLSI